MAKKQDCETRIAELEYQVDHLRKQFLLLSEHNEELRKRNAELEAENA